MKSMLNTHQMSPLRVPLAAMSMKSLLITMTVPLFAGEGDMDEAMDEDMDKDEDGAARTTNICHDVMLLKSGTIAGCLS